jgi:adenylate kinase family enzyme
VSMTTEADNQSVESIPRRDSTECKPLLDAATRELFQNNAFRITGLPVDATARKIANHADRLKVMGALGYGPSAQTAAFSLRVPPSLDQIRAAIQKLNDPLRRMVDEFFWFWPAEFGQGASDPAIEGLAAGKGEIAEQLWTAAETNPTAGVVAKHNLAVLWHLKALDLENNSNGGSLELKRRAEIEQTWRNALKRWEILIPDDALWEMVATRIRQIDDPGLTTGFARRMRTTLVAALTKINAELALNYAKAGNLELAKVHVQFMRETNQGGQNLIKAAELVLAPTIARVREHIKRAKQQAEGNPETANQAARELLAAAVPLVEIFALFLGEAEHPAKDLFEEVAGASNDCLVDFQRKTNVNKTYVELLERTLPLAKTDKLRQLIQKNIDHGRWMLLRGLMQAIRASTARPSEQLKQFQREAIQPLLTTAAKLQSNSEMRNGLMDDAALALNSISVDAWNKFRDKSTANKANDLAIQYVCSPELRQTLNENRELFRRKKPPWPAGTQKSSKSLPAGCWIFIALFVVYSIVNSCQSRRESSNNSSSRPPATATVSIHLAPSGLPRGQSSVENEWPSSESRQRITTNDLPTLCRNDKRSPNARRV